ncbi:MAG: hypothetical protein WCR46_19360, partial [Deltaproteobacteria bacterium]
MKFGSAENVSQNPSGHLLVSRGTKISLSPFLMILTSLPLTRCSSFFIQAAAGIISPIEPMFARRFNEGVG